MSATRTVVTKKKCCRDRPRCKKCPVVLKRLEGAGLATRLDRRTYEVPSKISKKTIKAARAGAI